MTTPADLLDALAGAASGAALRAASRAPLDRAWIAAHLPHSGAMCLLDAVESWDDARIVCTATSHRDPGNPLRSRGRLAAVCGVEYAAQAMAAHGALLASLPDPLLAPSTRANDVPPPARPRVGYLASVRNVAAHIERLDTLDAALSIEATRESGSGNTVLYGFALRGGERVLLTGRAAVMLDASAVIR